MMHSLYCVGCSAELAEIKLTGNKGAATFGAVCSFCGHKNKLHVL